MNEDKGCAFIIIAVFLVSFILGGCGKMNDMEKRLNWLEAEHRNLQWDFDKLKRDMERR